MSLVLSPGSKSLLEQWLAVVIGFFVLLGSAKHKQNVQADVKSFLLLFQIHTVWSKCSGQRAVGSAS